MLLSELVQQLSDTLSEPSGSVAACAKSWVGWLSLRPRACIVRLIREAAGRAGVLN